MPKRKTPSLEEGVSKAEVKPTKAQKKESSAEVKPMASKKSEGTVSKKTISIEHCKQCQCFKVRAAKIQSALESEGFTIEINKEKPRKGAFVVSLEGNKVFELLDMPRPFTKLKNTDFDEVIAMIKSKK